MMGVQVSARLEWLLALIAGACCVRACLQTGRLLLCTTPNQRICCHRPQLVTQTGAAARSGEAGRGCLFVAHRGAGAYATSLWDAAAPLERIHVGDMADSSGARFMESFESRHSDHSFTAQVVR